MRPPSRLPLPKSQDTGDAAFGNSTRASAAALFSSDQPTQGRSYGHNLFNKVLRPCSMIDCCVLPSLAAVRLSFWSVSGSRRRVFACRFTAALVAIPVCPATVFPELLFAGTMCGGAIAANRCCLAGAPGWVPDWAPESGCPARLTDEPRAGWVPRLRARSSPLLVSSDALRDAIVIVSSFRPQGLQALSIEANQSHPTC